MSDSSCKPAEMLAARQDRLGDLAHDSLWQGKSEERTPPGGSQQLGSESLDPPTPAGGNRHILGSLHAIGDGVAMDAAPRLVTPEQPAIARIEGEQLPSRRPGEDQ